MHIKKSWAVFLSILLISTLIPSNMKKMEAAPIIFEAEDGLLNGVDVMTQFQGYSGTGYVGGFDAQNDKLSVQVTVPDTGLYNLSIGYQAPHGTKNTSLVVGDTAQGEITLHETTNFSEVGAGKIMLQAGSTQISFISNWGWYYIDYVRLERAIDPPPHQINASLVNPDASSVAQSLYNYLRSEYGQHILSGQQTLADANWIHSTLGKKPAVLGLDLMDYSPSRIERGTVSTDIEHAIEWDAGGGIVTFAWHWNAPKDLIDQPGKEWWRGFYTEATTFDIEYAMSHPESQDYQLLIRDMDAIAVQLKRLQQEDIPVLWRPLHEAEGGWFWWGAKGPEPAKELYQLMYDRFTNFHGLDNLIWVWNSENPAWYPGDPYVDIISVDSYPGAGNYGPVSSRYENLKTLVNDQKIIALTENGPIPDPDLLQAYHADWSWFVTWSGEFIRDGVQNSTQHLTKVYNSPYVITLDELPDWKNEY
ncbi:glycosyl hydrolase [Paenibacillus provencensis]|uniref:Beta-1,4-mannanase n=2 Tax=Paenibacillus TaxID=44249 RepID=C6KL35_9BACL|nr:glycosyl hydrolase [Paenibacillus sp. MER 78]ACS92711.1 beta-1,4-mannanase [Paenibacillus sp. BME-14]MCM3128896.1 beta-mannanase [Paenibacillus sp. MER 78]